MIYSGPGDEVIAYTGERLIVSVEKVGQSWKATANYPGTDVARYMAMGTSKVKALIALDWKVTGGFVTH